MCWGTFTQPKNVKWVICDKVIQKCKNPFRVQFNITRDTAFGMKYSGITVWVKVPIYICNTAPLVSKTVQTCRMAEICFSGERRHLGSWGTVSGDKCAELGANSIENRALIVFDPIFHAGKRQCKMYLNSIKFIPLSSFIRDAFISLVTIWIFYCAEFSILDGFYLLEFHGT